MTTETVPCKWCLKPTPMLGTKMCDTCWELERRIDRDPYIAFRMLAQRLDFNVVMEKKK